MLGKRCVIEGNADTRLMGVFIAGVLGRALYRLGLLQRVSGSIQARGQVRFRVSVSPSVLFAVSVLCRACRVCWCRVVVTRS